MAGDIVRIEVDLHNTSEGVANLRLYSLSFFTQDPETFDITYLFPDDDVALFDTPSGWTFEAANYLYNEAYVDDWFREFSADESITVTITAATTAFDGIRPDYLDVFMADGDGLVQITDVRAYDGDEVQLIDALGPAHFVFDAFTEFWTNNILCAES